MRKLAILCLVIAAVTLFLGLVAKEMGGSLPLIILPGAVAPFTFLKIAKLFVLAAIPLALLEKK